jgi:ABC-type sugar transport system ATPase subunit
MAKAFTKLPDNSPGFRGEFSVATKLMSFPDDEIHLWFNIDYLPAVTELDVILLHPRKGLFLFEVKGYKLTEISKYSLNEFEIGDGEIRQHPLMQIKTGMYRLREYFKKQSQNRALTKPPFIQTSIIWPFISREEWIRNFRDSRIKSQSDSMFFSEDLVREDIFINKLDFLKDTPLMGVHPPRNRTVSAEEVSQLIQNLSPEVFTIQILDSTKSEIKKPVPSSSVIASEFVPPKKYQVSLEGPPGTGKSTILREIGLLHAAAGASVLHVCFNKVLAADQRREYGVLKQKQIRYGQIEVFDEWDLYSTVHHDWNNHASPQRTSTGAMDPSPIVEEIINFEGDENKHPIGIYDTILIDEAQDLSNSLFLLLDHLARPTASWFIAYGDGQQIYFPNEINPAPWLSEWRKTAEKKVLRRSFRNSSRAFLMAQNFWENFPNEEKVESWLEAKFSPKTPSDQMTLDLELDFGLPRESNDFRTIYHPDNFKVEPDLFYKHLIIETLEDAKKARRGEDILIVVGSKNYLAESSTYRIIKKVITELKEDLEFEILDLTARENRRVTPQNESIRVVFHQSVRGLSASHVIVTDLDLLEDWVGEKSNTKGPIRNYGYINLSRSKSSTTIVIKNPNENQVERFIENSLLEIRKKYLNHNQ